MAAKIKTHLMFEGSAEEAMNLYVSLIRGSEVLSIERYGASEQGVEGSVKTGTFSLAGREFISIDSPIKHDFTFTPSMSVFVDFDDEAELMEAYDQLSSGGAVLMPLDDYGFSRKFAWIADRFGVSWQLNLP